MGDVLVDEEDLVRRMRDDERVLDLAHHRSEAHPGLVSRLRLSEQRRLRGLRRLGTEGRPRGRRERTVVHAHRESSRCRVAPGQRLMHALVDQVMERPRLAEPHPRLAGVDVDVDLTGREGEDEEGEGKLVPREQRPIRFDQRLGQEGVADGAAVDDEVDVIAVSPRHRRRPDDPGEPRASPFARHVEQPLGEPESVEGSEARPGSVRRRSVEHEPGVGGDADVDAGMRENQLGHRADDRRLLRGRALQELRAGGCVEEEVPDLDRGAGRPLDLLRRLDHAALAEHEEPARGIGRPREEPEA